MNWPGGTSDSTPRVVWCPYVAENPSDPSDVVNMVALFKVVSLVPLNKHRSLLIHAKACRSNKIWMILEVSYAWERILDLI